MQYNPWNKHVHALPEFKIKYIFLIGNERNYINRPWSLSWVPLLAYNGFKVNRRPSPVQHWRSSPRSLGFFCHLPLSGPSTVATINGRSCGRSSTCGLLCQGVLFGNPPRFLQTSSSLCLLLHMLVSFFLSLPGWG